MMMIVKTWVCVGTLVCGCVRAEFVCVLHKWSLLLITGYSLVIFNFFKKGLFMCLVCFATFLFYYYLIIHSINR